MTNQKIISVSVNKKIYDKFAVYELRKKLNFSKFVEEAMIKCMADVKDDTFSQRKDKAKEINETLKVLNNQVMEYYKI